MGIRLTGDTAAATPARKPLYLLVAAALFTFWAAVVVCVTVVFTMAAWDDRTSPRDASAAAPTPEPTSTPVTSPRPADVPLTAQPVEGTFDTGAPERHLFFHIGCVNGVLAVVTTDEHVYAQTFCPQLTRAQIEPFLGKPVRITIGDRRIDVVSPIAGRLQFPIDRAWVELPP